MQSNSVLRSEQAYKRGLILGLTMAEIVLLLLFSLLLALAALFLEREKAMNQIKEERDHLVSALRLKVFPFRAYGTE